MKEFFETMEKDYLKENFTKKQAIIYGVFAPLIFFAILLTMSILEQMMTTPVINQ